MALRMGGLYGQEDDIQGTFGRSLGDTQPEWARWYDMYLAHGGGNPVSKSEFNALAHGSPEGSNQLRGTQTQPMLTTDYMSPSMQGLQEAAKIQGQPKIQGQLRLGQRRS